jgi:dynein heavy chain
MTKEQITHKPRAGVNIYGLFIQGARWDWIEGKMAESEAKVLFMEKPVILLSSY